MTLKETLYTLTNELGGSGNELAVAKRIRDILKDDVDSVEINDFFCVIARQNSELPGAKTFLFDAHIDQVAMTSLGVTEDGFIRFSASGFDLRQLYGADVVIETRKHGLVPGVVNTVPAALNKEGRSKAMDIEKLTIDIGYPPEKVKEMIHIGDYIYYANETMDLACGTVCGRAMDDRAGATILIEMARRLREKDIPVNVVYSFTPREESGGPGAVLTGHLIQPDVALAIDGAHAKSWAYSGSDAYDFNAGVVIGLGDHSYRAYADSLVETANKMEIPYVRNVTPAYSKTNAGRLEYAGLGIPTVVVEFPMRNAHSSVEIVNLDNLNCVCDLLTEYVLSGRLKR